MPSSYDDTDNDDKKPKPKTTSTNEIGTAAVVIPDLGTAGGAVIPDGVDVKWSSNVIFDASNNNKIVGNDIGMERLDEKIKIEKKNKPSATTLNKFILRRIYNAMQSEYNTTFLRVETNPITGQKIYTKLQLNDVTSLLAQIDATSSSTSARSSDSTKPMSLDPHPVTAATVTAAITTTSITPASLPTTSSSLNIPTDMECDDSAPAASTATVVVTSEVSSPPTPILERPLSAYNLFYLVERKRILKEMENIQDPIVLFNQLPTKPKASTNKTDSAYTISDIANALNNRTTDKSPKNSKIDYKKLAILIAKRWRLVCSEQEQRLFHDYSKNEMDRYKQQHQQQGQN